MKRPGPRVLVVGGVDSSGGAGLDADRDAARGFDAALEVFVSADTVQDSRRVQSVEPRPFWWYDAGYVIEDGIDAVKLGLLPDAESIVGAGQLAGHARSAGMDLPVVVDTVIAASSGTRFWTSQDVAAFRRIVLPASPVLTPNLPELAELAEVPEATLARDPTARVAAARRLLRAGARAVVVKGGHGGEDPLVDLVLDRNSEPVWIERPREPGPGIRGSGCRFATALACGLGLHRGLEQAARDAGELVADRIRGAGSAGH